MKKILLVKEDQSLGYFFENLRLDLKGYSFHSVSNSFEAVEWMRQGNRPYAILIDLHEEGNLGVKFIRYLRASGIFNDIPVVLFVEKNNHVPIEINERGLFNGLLRKPFDPETFTDTIENMIMSTVQPKNTMNYA